MNCADASLFEAQAHRQRMPDHAPLTINHDFTL